MVKLVVVTPPVVEVVSLAEAKAQLRVLHTSEDVLIARYIRAARQHFEGSGGMGGILGRCIAPQTLKWSFAAFPGGLTPITPPRGPVRAVTSIVYRDAASVEQTLDPAQYDLEPLSDDLADIVPAVAWPAGASRIAVTYEAGYVTEDMPEPLRQACLMLIQHWYDQRSAAGDRMEELPFAVDALVRPYTSHGWI